MRVLIIVVPQGKMRSYQMPIGIGYVSASLKRAGHQVLVLNPNHSLDPLAQSIERAVLDFAPQIIATGGMAFHSSQIREIVGIARRAARQAIIVIGGLFVTNQPEVAMAAVPEADIGVIGEGEQTSVDLLAALSAGAGVEAVPGLILRDGAAGAFRLTPPRPMQDDLATLPWIDFDGLGLDIYASLHRPGEVAPGLIVDDNARVMPFLTSRGCPFPCTFCCHQAAGRRYRMRPLDDVFAELETAVDRYGINTLVIYDDLFCLKQQHLAEFCQRVKPLKLRWQCSIRVEQVNPEVLRLMRDSGCQSISFGVESMSPVVLASMKKKTTREALEQALQQMYDAKITTWANLIFGDPAETWETAMDSLDWWVRNNRFDLRTAFIGYHPGSQIYDQARRNNLIADPLAFLESGNPEINATVLNNQDFLKLRQTVGQTIMLFGFYGKILQSEMRANGEVDLTTVCPHCQVENRYQRFALSPDRVPRLSCRACNQLYRLPMLYRPPASAELIRLRAEIDALIGPQPAPLTDPQLEQLYPLTIRLVEIDVTQEAIWDLAIRIADHFGRASLALNLLSGSALSNPLNPVLFEQMAARLTAIGQHEDAERFGRQAKQLRAVGITGPVYWT